MWLLPHGKLNLLTLSDKKVLSFSSFSLVNIQWFHEIFFNNTLFLIILALTSWKWGKMNFAAIVSFVVQFCLNKWLYFFCSERYSFYVYCSSFLHNFFWVFFSELTFYLSFINVFIFWYLCCFSAFKSFFNWSSFYLLFSEYLWLILYNLKIDSLIDRPTVAYLTIEFSNMLN